MIYEQTSNYSAAQFNAAVPWAEMEALGILRRSIHQVHVAETRARHAAAIALDHPADARLARCAAALRDAVPLIQQVAVGEVRAFFGDGPEVVFIRDCEAASLTRIEFAADAWSIIEPDQMGYHPVEVFDLVEAEKAIGRRIIEFIITEPDKQARCLTTFEDVMTGRDTTTHLGDGGHSVASLAGLTICTTIGY